MDLKGLSQRLGLSMTTVSRALNGYADVSASTRARVLEAARDTGYSPNPVARRLALGRAETIGVVLPNPPSNFVDAFFAELLAGLGSVFERAHLDLIVTAAPEGPDELPAYQRLVEGRRVDGLIVARTRSRDERIAYLLDRQFPFVAHGRTTARRPYAFLDMDNEHGFAIATERLIALGHRRIALINAPPHLAFATGRRTGYEKALRAAAVPVDPTIVAACDLSGDDTDQLVETLLDQPDPPTAIICANDNTALAAMRAAKQRGRVIGRDLSIIGYDDLPFAAQIEPPLTTLRQPTRAAGARIADMLLARIAGTPANELQEVWQPRLICRGTDGPAPGTAGDEPASSEFTTPERAPPINNSQGT